MAARWIFTINSSIININEEAWLFTLTPILSLILVSVFLWKRLNILTFDRSGNKIIIIIACVATVTIVSWKMQFALKYLSGKVHVVETIEEIDLNSPWIFYRINNFNVTTDSIAFIADYRYSGKHNHLLNLKYNAALPFVTNLYDHSGNSAKIWCGITFIEQTGSDGYRGPDNLNEKFNNFIKECHQYITIRDFSKYTYFEKVIDRLDIKKYNSAIRTRIGYQSDASYLILEPVKKSLYQRGVENLIWGMFLLFVGIVIIFAVLVNGKYDEEEHIRQLSGKGE